MKKRLLLALLPCLYSASSAADLSITQDELHRAIEGYWIGQLAGNYIGFPFENIYEEDPIPVYIDRYYTYEDAEKLGLEMNIEDRRAFIHILAEALGGAWSDDDSDIEFVYLHAVEKYGLDLTYEETVGVWKAHINRFVWSANKRARELMDEGLIPPATGSREHNEHWYRLSSQLTTEIWGVFYPGLTQKGGQASLWAGKVTTDDWATHPDLFFGTIFSAAFFESDVNRLVEIGRDVLPEESPFREGIDLLIQWRSEHEDWRETRKLMHERYYERVGDFEIPDPVAGSIINGLSAVLALLYGDGDWLQTVAIATTVGYDCDNQAATCGALMGLILGADAIPEHLTLELPSRGRWSKPFNDTYINYSRDGLPAFNRISDIVNRIQAVAEQGIFLGGGRRVEAEDGSVSFLIPVDFPVEKSADR